MPYASERPLACQAIHGKDVSGTTTGFHVTSVQTPVPPVPQGNNAQGRLDVRNRRQRRARPAKKPMLALTEYLAVKCDACTRPECRIMCKSTGKSYQKCHVR